MDELVSGLLGELTRFLGRLVLKIVTMGRWRGERSNEGEGSIYSAAGSIWFKRDGQIVFTDTGLLFIGMGFYCFCLLVLFVVFYQGSR